MGAGLPADETCPCSHWFRTARWFKRDWIWDVLNLFDIFAYTWMDSVFLAAGTMGCLKSCSHLSLTFDLNTPLRRFHKVLETVWQISFCCFLLFVFVWGATPSMDWKWQGPKEGGALGGLTDSQYKGINCYWVSINECLPKPDIAFGAAGMSGT